MRTTTKEGHLSTHDFILRLVQFFERANERFHNEDYGGIWSRDESLERWVRLDLPEKPPEDQRLVEGLLTLFATRSNDALVGAVSIFQLQYASSLLRVMKKV